MFIIMVAVVVLVGIAGLVVAYNARGNQQWFDITKTFDQAIIYLPNGNVIEGAVESWLDFEDGDQIQVKIDGVTYLTHIENVVLLSN